MEYLIGLALDHRNLVRTVEQHISGCGTFSFVACVSRELNSSHVKQMLREDAWRIIPRTQDKRMY